MQSTILFFKSIHVMIRWYTEGDDKFNNLAAEETICKADTLHWWKLCVNEPALIITWVHEKWASVLNQVI